MQLMQLAQLRSCGRPGGSVRWAVLNSAELGMASLQRDAAVRKELKTLMEDGDVGGATRRG